MSLDEILEILIAAVTQSQEQSLRAVNDFHAGTRLIGDVPGCDSLAAVELLFLLADGLAPILGGREFPDALLLGRTKTERPTLGQIAQRIHDFACCPKPKRTSTKASAKRTNPEPLDGEASKGDLSSPNPQTSARVISTMLMPLDIHQFSEHSNGSHNR